MVLGALLGGAAEFFTPKARAFGHALFWGLNFGLFVVMSIYVGLKEKWGPFALVVTGALLVMVDLTRHILLDFEIVGEQGAMYNDNEDGSSELSLIGMVGVVCTWLGILSIGIGLGWFVNLPAKVIEAWKGATAEKSCDA